MKPSNTGIDWWQYYSFDGPAKRILNFLDGEDFVDACEWAAQIAIAEYRKELAAKVEAMPWGSLWLMISDLPNWDGCDCERGCDRKSAEAALEQARLMFLALLNENDNAE